MFRKPWPLIVFALLALAGCQTEDIYALSDNCPDVETFREQDKVICTRDSIADCYANHDKKHDTLKQTDFAAAFENNRCPVGFECSQSAKTCTMKLLVECQKGDTKCVDKVLQECKQGEDGKYDWVATEQECSAVCTNDDTKCSEAKIYTCINGQWASEPTEVCEFGCKEGAIQNSSQALECYACGEPSDVCEENVLVSCEDHEITRETCEYGCFTNAGESYCADCHDGDQECEGDILMVCSEERDWEEHTCEFGCQNAMCNNCQPGAIRCDAQDSQKYQACGQDGTWGSSEICEFGCQNNRCNDCAPGTKVCKQGSLQSCGSDGRWAPDVKCELGCSNGHCNDCEEGKTKCMGNTALQTCVDGYWDVPKNCLDQYICKTIGTKADCVIDETIDCTPGAKKCEGNKARICDYNKTWYTDEMCTYGCDEATGKCIRP